MLQQLKIYVNDVEVDMYKHIDAILLIKLKPDQIFECTMNARLGIGIQHVIWSSIKNVHYTFENDKLIFTFKSNGQYTEIELLHKACRCIFDKLLQIEKNILHQEPHIKFDMADEILYEITFDNENHTLIYLLNHWLQDHKDITFAGCYKKSFLTTYGICIKIKTTNTKPLQPIFDTIEKSRKFFLLFEQKLKALKL
jgi:DNA-directed RNA polymerase subunit L